MTDDRKCFNVGKRSVQALALGLALSACNLDADLPHLLTDAAIQSSTSAELQVMSAIAAFECASSTFGNIVLGHEDVMESIAGAGSTMHRFRATPAGGATCDTGAGSQSFFDQILGARALLSTAPSRLVSSGSGTGRGVYDRIQDEWSLGAEGERLSAMAAIYMGASLNMLGEFFCEAAIDGSDLLTPDDLLGLADDWLTNRALQHINSVGDFAMPNGIAPSARNMALGLRARTRWARGDLAGAAADAATILASDGEFTAWITREAGLSRRNKIHVDATAASRSGMLGINDWWNPATRPPNPATGQPWPDPIPHTGYLFLGIMPDGRALEAGNVPVLWANETRGADGDPVLLNNGAVPDTRVQHEVRAIQGPEPRDVPLRFTSDSDNIPLISWRELTLIRAELDHSQGALGAAIAKVNELRAYHGLPQVSGAYQTQLLGSATAVRHLLLEERRREFYSEGGRYYSTKIQNTDVLWFPRQEGQTPFQGYELLGGVRFLFGADEYTSNPHFVQRGALNARGTGCDPNQAPDPGSV